MNYCVYNKRLDQFLYLFYSYDERGTPICEAKWGDEFLYALADPDCKHILPQEVWETVWPMDMEDIHDNYSLFVYRRIDEMNASKDDIRNMGFVPVTDDIPDFEKEYASEYRMNNI